MIDGEFDTSRYYMELAERYHARCDAYDKAVCSGTRDGVPMPVGSQEAGLVNRHARSVLADLASEACEKLEESGDTVMAKLRRATRDWSRYKRES